MAVDTFDAQSSGEFGIERHVGNVQTGSRSRLGSMKKESVCDWYHEVVLYIYKKLMFRCSAVSGGASSP